MVMLVAATVSAYTVKAPLSVLIVLNVDIDPGAFGIVVGFQFVERFQVFKLEVLVDPVVAPAQVWAVAT